MNSLSHDALVVLKSVYNYSFFIIQESITNCGPPSSLKFSSAFKNEFLLLSFTLVHAAIELLKTCILSMHPDFSFFILRFEGNYY